MTAKLHPAPTPPSTPSQFVPASIFHDLRTPLNQIIGYSEMLAEQAQEEGQRGYLPDLQKIRSAGGQLLALINNQFQAQNAVMRPSALTTAHIPNPMPAEKTTGSSQVTVEQPTSRAEQGLLLVVDDNEMNRDVLSRRLKRQGHSVVVAQNGQEALALMRIKAFDLVLLDIMMPQMDGYEMLQQLKADQTLCHIPVIMISALHEMESVVRCIEMGADDYLCKPFDPTLLKARIGACLDKKHAHDREVGLFDQLQESYKRLQELEQQRDDLTHMIIHDLRIPLTSVITGMQTLDIVGDLNEDQREMMGIAILGGETLLDMINDLLDVEKLKSGSMQLDYAMLSAAELVASAVGQVASLTQSKQLTLVQQIAAGLPPLPGDENRLRRTLVNLLGNAIKFTPSGGTITVKAHYNKDKQSVLFSVSDTGEGIPSEAFERIFEKFGQVASRQGGRAMSTGLGLTFCKLAVEAHGGHIGVKSTPGQGSIFYFTVPFQSPSEQIIRA